MGSIAGSNIEWRFLIALKITFNKVVPCADRIKAIYADIHSNQHFPTDTFAISLLMMMQTAFAASSSPTNFNRSIMVGGTSNPRASRTIGAIASRAAVAFCRASEMPSTSHIAPLSVFFDVYGIIRALSISPKHRPHDRQPLLSAIWRQSCHHCR